MKRPVAPPASIDVFDADEVTDIGAPPRTSPATNDALATYSARARTHPEVRGALEDHTEIHAVAAEETSTSHSAIRIQRFRMPVTDPIGAPPASPVTEAARARLVSVEKLLRDMQARVAQLDSNTTRGWNADLALALHDLEAVRDMLRTLDEAPGRK